MPTPLPETTRWPRDVGADGGDVEHHAAGAAGGDLEGGADRGGVARHGCRGAGWVACACRVPGGGGAGHGPGEDVDDDVGRGAGGQAQVDGAGGGQGGGDALAMVWPATKLTEEVVTLPGAGVDRGDGQPAAGGRGDDGDVEGDRPDRAGTPPRPVTCRCARPPLGRAPVRPPRPVRVSISRAGASVPVIPGPVGAPAVVHPATSATRFTEPGAGVAQADGAAGADGHDGHVGDVLPGDDVQRRGGGQRRYHRGGRVTCPVPVASATVTCSTTAPTPEAGTPPGPGRSPSWSTHRTATPWRPRARSGCRAPGAPPARASPRPRRRRRQWHREVRARHPSSVAPPTGAAWAVSGARDQRGRDDPDPQLPPTHLAPSRPAHGPNGSWCAIGS